MVMFSDRTLSLPPSTPRRHRLPARPQPSEPNHTITYIAGEKNYFAHHQHHHPSTQDGLGRAKNPVKYLQSIEQRARERQVAYETVRLLRRDVIECYRKEGVNHYENCKVPVERYARLVLKQDVGQVHPDFKDEGKKYGS